MCRIAEVGGAEACMLNQRASWHPLHMYRLPPTRKAWLREGSVPERTVGVRGALGVHRCVWPLLPPRARPSSRLLATSICRYAVWTLRRSR